MNDTVSWLTFLSGLFGKDKSKRRYARVVPKDGERIEVRIEGENSGPLQAQDISENGIGIVVPSGFSGRSNGDVVELNVGVAVGTEKGLVVPVVRDADRLSLAEIERTIAELGRKARDGALDIQDLQGGTFTISNGGVYGSLMSTPILNAPQSGILGMHKIQERPVVIDGKIEARPMMYLALSYDHRLVDGKEAVTFLVRVKELLEDPARLALGL